MDNEQKKSRNDKFNVWLANLSYIAVVITLILIMVQIFYAKRTMNEAHEWEKAKMTIENIERFKEHLKETALYGKTNVLLAADGPWPDFTTPEGYKSADTLWIIYNSLFDGDHNKVYDDFFNTLAIMDAFAYPIIMGYASETGSYQSIIREYYWYGNYIMPTAFHHFPNIGLYAKLLYRLWRTRSEYEIFIRQQADENARIEYFKQNINKLLCFDGTEITPASIEQYSEKLEKELKKIQKEIEVFRKNSLK